MRTNIRYSTTALSLCLFVCSCSSPHSPAPVSVLNSQPSTVYPVANESKYTVKKGDTLYGIAWYTGNDYRDLALWNKISAPYLIKPGEILNVRRPEVKIQRPEITNSASASTSSVKTTKTIESRKDSAYGVNSKSVSHTYKSEKPKQKKQFPVTVEKWVWPANGKVVGTYKTSGAVNRGIDIQAPEGSPVVSTADGKVVYTGNALRGYGNLVIVKHSETFLSAYAHNSKIVVNEQQWVQAGEQIATVGSSGSDSTMLHFEVRYKGKSLDPMRFLSAK